MPVCATIFAGSDLEMISKLAKNVAHFFVMVMQVFSYGICNISGQIAQIFSIGFISIALPIIFCIAPVPHPNKPMSEEKGVKLRKRSIYNQYN